ncbi:MAG: phosphoketolase, partial [Polyangiaceae bacterium]
DIVLGCAGDTATLETVAAAWWLKKHAPALTVRVVNVVDLMTLFSPFEHPHGMSDGGFNDLFTADTLVIFAFHGYPGNIHQFLHGRPNAHRFHVRGYKEEGTTTTPFDMVVLNGMSRFHLAKEAIKRARTTLPNAAELMALCDRSLEEHRAYVRENLEDMPEIRDWNFSAS